MIFQSGLVILTINYLNHKHRHKAKATDAILTVTPTYLSHTEIPVHHASVQANPFGGGTSALQEYSPCLMDDSMGYFHLNGDMANRHFLLRLTPSPH